MKEPITYYDTCDDNLLTRLSILLQSIADNLSHCRVYFCLGKWEMSERETMNGHRRGSWCKEAYFSLEAYQHLPQDIDRILYLDAGDILVVDDITMGILKEKTFW